MPLRSPVLRRRIQGYRNSGNKPAGVPTAGRKPHREVSCAARVFVPMTQPDNQTQNKRVESIEGACLDPGSTPGDSTAFSIPPLRGGREEERIRAERPLPAGIPDLRGIRRVFNNQHNTVAYAMRKIFRLLLLLCLPMAAQAQYFQLSPEGFVSVSDPTKKYIVLDFPDNTQQQAFEKVHRQLQAEAGDAYDLVLLPQERITATGTAQIDARAGIFPHPYQMKYTLVIRFKDGRIRIDSPRIDDMYSEKDDIRLYATLPQKGVNAYFIYDKDGEVKNKLGKENLEKFFNEFVNRVIAAFKASDGDDDDDDW